MERGYQKNQYEHNKMELDKDLKEYIESLSHNDLILFTIGLYSSQGQLEQRIIEQNKEIHELNASRTLLSSMFDNHPSPMVYIVNDTITRVNQAFLDLTESKNPDALQHSLQEILEKRFPGISKNFYQNLEFYPHGDKSPILESKSGQKYRFLRYQLPENASGESHELLMLIQTPDSERRPGDLPSYQEKIFHFATQIINPILIVHMKTLVIEYANLPAHEYLKNNVLINTPLSNIYPDLNEPSITKRLSGSGEGETWKQIFDHFYPENQVTPTFFDGLNPMMVLIYAPQQSTGGLSMTGQSVQQAKNNDVKHAENIETDRHEQTQGINYLIFDPNFEIKSYIADVAGVIGFDLKTKNLLSLIDESQRDELKGQVWQLLQKKIDRFTMTVTLSSQPGEGVDILGSFFRIEAGDDLPRAVCMIIDTNVESSNAQGLVDRVSELPNRQLFMDRLGHAILLSRRENKLLALLAVKFLDDEMIKRRFDQSAFNRMIRRISKRLENCLRDSDTIARIGDSEFGVILENVGNFMNAGSICRKVISELNAPMMIDGRELAAEIRIGVALSSSDSSAEVLLSQAKNALKAVLDDPHNRYAVYNSDLIDGFSG